MSRLADHVTPRIDEERLERQWTEISSRVAGTKRRVSVGYYIAAPVFAMVACTFLIILTRKPESKMITLPEGSTVVLERDAALVVSRAEPDHVRLSLNGGSIDIRATHRDGRTFVVASHGHEVAVIGTHFRVHADAKSVGVEVDEGAVKIDGSSVVRAGEKWSAPPQLEPPSAPTPAPETSPAPTATASEEPAAVPSASSSTAKPTVAEGPKELLSRATEARTSGHNKEAAAAFDQLRKKHRADPRAGLAAFELGRIRLDALSDPAGAAEAFADAIALSPQATFREDAEARRVEALERAGNVDACAKAKALYLERYPSGLYRRQISNRCSGH